MDRAIQSLVKGLEFEAKVVPLMTTLFSLKGMCAFKEECGTPSPCFRIKGGGEPHFLVYTILGGETLALP